VLLLLGLVSPVYRDVFLDERDRYRGASFADFAGHLEYDRRLLHDFSWGAWFWNPDKAFGIPRFLELNNRPLYPIHFVFLAVLPTLAAWHWLTVFHVALRAFGLVLLGCELRWPFWLVVASAVAAMLAEGTLEDFGDVVEAATGAWIPLLAWLTVRAGRSYRWTRSDSGWILFAAVWTTGAQLNFAMYYHVLLGCLAGAFGWSCLRRQMPKLVARYVVLALLLMPLLLPALSLYAESGRAHYAEFTDWHLRRAFNFRNYWVRWSDFSEWILWPPGAWAALAALLILQRGRIGPIARAFGIYGALGILHSVRYAPLWYLGSMVPGLRISQRIFEPLPWLIVLPLAETGLAVVRSRWRPIGAACLASALVSIAVFQAHDQRTSYVWPRWTRPLPFGLAAAIHAERRAAVLPLTGPDRAADDAEPLLNSNHQFFLGLPSAHFFGEIPTHPFLRATYRVPGLLFMQRAPTAVEEWEAVVDLYAELGIRWVVWDGETTPAHPRLRLVGSEAGFRLYEILAARPLVYGLRNVRVVPRPGTPAEVASLVYTLPTEGPFCYGCPPETADGPAETMLEWHWAPGRVKVRVDTSGRILVVLGESYASGWRATMDGEPAPILQVNEMFQGVWVPSGRHQVVWRYEEPRFLAGAAAAGLGLLLCLVLPRSWPRVRE